MLKELLKRYHQSVSRPTRAVVYFMQPARRPAEPIKIGVSSPHGLMKRRNSVQTGHPDWLAILGVLPAPDRMTALRMEKELHRLLVSTRRNGEWFNPSPTLLDIIKRSTRI